MLSHKTINEKFLKEIWKNQKFDGEIYSLTGDRITIYDNGIENTEAGGPDFINARIKIGNITFVGDVEIDNFYSDWKLHGHNLNKRFNKVILHAILNNDSNHNSVHTQNGREVPSISFEIFINKSIKSKLQDAIISERTKRLKKIHCFELTSIAENNLITDYLTEMGIIRFKKKCERFIHRLKEIIFLSSVKIKEPAIGYDIPKDFFDRKCTIEELSVKENWEQLFYENLFEALGYSQNKNIMQKLAQAIEISFIKNLKIDYHLINKLESVFFNVSGILPEGKTANEIISSEYIRHLHENWIEIRTKYDGLIFKNEDWNFFKIRPQNFPTIRIAGGVRLIVRIIKQDLISNCIKKFTEINNLQILIRNITSLFVVKAEGYWSKHYVFNKESKDEIKFFVGTSRAEEIFINVVLPFSYIYFKLFQKEYLADKVLKTYTQCTINIENSLVNEISGSFNISNSLKKTVLNQGMIELFRSYCVKEKCNECKIGIKVFN